MINSKLSMQVFGVYLVLVVGLGLILIPHIMLGLFGLAAGDDAWIRMVGMLASIVGAYYLLAARSDMEKIYRWSVPLRVYAAVFMASLFLMGTLSTGILLFALIDFSGAVWTCAALRAEQQKLAAS